MMRDELLHAIKAIVLQVMQEQRPFVYAHISNWDPVAHAVRVVVPSIRDELTGEPLVSGWLPLGTQQAGSGVGIQVAPVGGASLADPTAGEQCLVAVNERGTGVASVVSLFFNNKSLAPSSTLVDPHSGDPSPLLAGEMVATSNGITVRWRSDQTFEVTAGRVDVTTSGDVDLTVKGNINETVVGDVSIATNQLSVAADVAVNLEAPVVRLGVSPVLGVARVGDTVVNGAGTVIGTIKSGSANVFAS